MNEWLTVTTSSPGATPTAWRARSSAAVPLATAHACGAPTNAGELGLERLDLGSLGEPARREHPLHRRGLLGAGGRPGERDHPATVAAWRAATSRIVSSSPVVVVNPSAARAVDASAQSRPTSPGRTGA